MSRKLIRFIAFIALAVHISMPLAMASMMGAAGGMAMGSAPAETVTLAEHDCEALHAEKHDAAARFDHPATPGHPGNRNHNMPPCCGVCSLTPSCVNPAVAKTFKPETIANTGVHFEMLTGDTGRIASREQYPPRAPPSV